MRCWEALRCVAITPSGSRSRLGQKSAFGERSSNVRITPKSCRHCVGSTSCALRGHASFSRPADEKFSVLRLICKRLILRIAFWMPLGCLKLGSAHVLIIARRGPTPKSLALQRFRPITEALSPYRRGMTYSGPELGPPMLREAAAESKRYARSPSLQCRAPRKTCPLCLRVNAVTLPLASRSNAISAPTDSATKMSLSTDATSNDP